MQIETISPRRAIDNAFLQESITETEFETFRQRLLKLLKEADGTVADTCKLEEEIDQLVYEHYGLNKEEVKIVEESFK